ncbi:MAG: pentapeptide repeat-containing protein [Cyanobacteria bacterium P01_A01_bin.114]
MKLNIRHIIYPVGVTAAAVLPLLWLIQPVLSEKLDDLKRLQLTENCEGCDLSGANLSGQHLIGSDLRNANLVGANLSYANLEGADLSNADLTGANLTGAFLTNADLSYTNLTEVNFTQARLYYVNVTGATISDLNLADAEVIETPISVGGEADSLPIDLAPVIPDEVLPYEPPVELLRPVTPTEGPIQVPPQTMPDIE